MPLFDHLNTPHDPAHDDPTGNGHRPPADLSPIVPGRGGRPSFSLEALRELVQSQFQAETAHRPDILRELATERERRALVREVTDYVLAVEAIALSAADKSALIESAYRHLFTFGPLDDALRDDAVTEITINGPAAIHVRRGLGPLAAVAAAFDDRDHLAALIERLLPGDSPFVEAGLVMLNRTARVSLVAPPVSPDYSLTIRLHPARPLTLDDLRARFGVLPAEGADLLRAILAADRGLLIVGDVALGKTTLAGALIPALYGTLTAVERAAELDLPPDAGRLTPVPPAQDQPGVGFAEQLGAALDGSPDWLVVDEIRGDEAAPLWDVLARDDAPRCLLVFRGAGQPDRLRSALSMVVRRAHPAIEQAAIHRALARHLPYVAVLKRTPSGPRLGTIGAWALSPEAEALDLRPLIALRGDRWQMTGALPEHDLALPPDFWTPRDLL